MKAEFPNADLQLWPGQFVNVRAAGRDAEAGGRGPDRRRAARAQRHLRLRRRAPTSTVAVRPVTVTQQDETQAVIANGLDRPRSRSSPPASPA